MNLSKEALDLNPLSKTTTSPLMQSQALISSSIAFPSLAYDCSVNTFTDEGMLPNDNPFLVQNLHYNSEQDFYVCPMGQRMQCVGEGKRVSTNGYGSQVSCYEARRCEGCPLRGMCHKANGNRRVKVSHNLNRHKGKAKERMLSEKGLYHRSKRPVEVEAAFGQMKSNNKFSRSTLRGLDMVAVEFGLMALGHNLRKLIKKKSTKPKNSHNKTKNTLNIINGSPIFLCGRYYNVAA